MCVSACLVVVVVFLPSGVINFAQRHPKEKKSMVTPWLFNKLPRPVSHSVLPDGRNFMAPVRDKLPKVIWSSPREARSRLMGRWERAEGVTDAPATRRVPRVRQQGRFYHLLWSTTCRRTTLERRLGRQRSFLNDWEHRLPVRSCRGVSVLNVNLLLFWPSKQKLCVSGGHFKKNKHSLLDGFFFRCCFSPWLIQSSHLKVCICNF